MKRPDWKTWRRRLKWALVFYTLVIVLGGLYALFLDPKYAGYWVKREEVVDLKKAGAILYTERGCIACHGAGGDKPIIDGYPKLTGQNRKYLEEQTRQIRDGKRDNGASHYMRQAIRELSDTDIQAIATYLSGE